MTYTYMWRNLATKDDRFRGSIREFKVTNNYTILHLQWTRVKNGRGRLKKRADALRVEGRRRRGRLRMRWEDCVKRYLAGMGEEWRTRTRDNMGEWRRQ